MCVWRGGGYKEKREKVRITGFQSEDDDTAKRPKSTVCVCVCAFVSSCPSSHGTSDTEGDTAL